jgi:hypothetical protein
MEIQKNEVQKHKNVKEASDYDPDKRIKGNEVKERKNVKEVSDYNPDKRIGINEKEVVTGGKYSDVKKYSDGNTHEVHHIPADSATKLDRNDGPAIKMEKADHKKTASYGNSKEARAYRDEQKKLIDAGKSREAFEMDVNDVKNKCGNKYDSELAQAREYYDKLENEHKI